MLAVLAFVVLGVALYVIQSNTVSSRTAQIARLRSENLTLLKQASVFKPYEAVEQLSTQRNEIVTELAGSRFDWQSAFNQLGEVIPAGVTLTSVAGTQSPSYDSAAGSTSNAVSNPLRSDVAVPAITLSGCAVNQSTVALLLSRLQSVSGATRVSLYQSSSSTSSSTATTTSSSSSGQSSTVTPCVAGSPPVFSIVVFFGNAPTGPPVVPGGSASSSSTSSSGTTK